MFLLVYILHLNFTFHKKGMEIKHIPYFKDNIIAKSFGILPNGKEIFTHQLTNKNGMELHIIDYGAAITAIKIPLKNGKLVDVVLGFDTLEKYIQSFHLPSAPYFGAIVGRFAGRINKGIFDLNGKTYQLHQNNNQHSLHGGINGYSQVVWKAEEREIPDGSSITFSYLSQDNEEFFPGDLKIKVTYTLTEFNEIKIKYDAFSDQDTIVNLTHHSYFNLDGHNTDIKNQDLFVNAEYLLEKTEENIPTGRFLDLTNHPFDFNLPKKCPTAIDDTFILPEVLEPIASLSSAANGIKMNVFTDQPGLHIYIGGNCFNQLEGKENANYHTTSGICFETQNFPDAPNHPHFPDAVLKKGETYTQRTIYKFEMMK